MINERIKNELPPLPENSVLICTLKGCEDCEGYAIDANSNVWSCKAHNFTPFYFSDSWRMLKSKINPHGYKFVIMTNKERDFTITIHRLIGLAFIPNSFNFRCINHINGIKSDNRIENLEWCTHQHNSIHSITNNLRDTAKGERLPNSILKESDIYEIFSLKISGLSNREISEKYNVDWSVITNIILRKSWKHIKIDQSSIELAQSKNIMKGINNPQSKLNDEKVKEIILKLGSGISAKKVAKEYGVSDTLVGKIKKKESWGHVSI